VEPPRSPALPSLGQRNSYQPIGSSDFKNNLTARGQSWTQRESREPKSYKKGITRLSNNTRPKNNTKQGSPRTEGVLPGSNKNRRELSPNWLPMGKKDHSSIRGARKRSSRRGKPPNLFAREVHQSLTGLLLEGDIVSTGGTAPTRSEEVSSQNRPGPRTPGPSSD